MDYGHITKRLNFKLIATQNQIPIPNKYFSGFYRNNEKHGRAK